MSAPEDELDEAGPDVSFLADPVKLAALAALAERAESIESMLTAVEQGLRQALEPAEAAAGDSQAAGTGTGPEQPELDRRLRSLLRFVLFLEDPRALGVLERLVQRLDKLDRLLEALEAMPGLIGFLAENVDELFRESAGAEQSVAGFRAEVRELVRAGIFSPDAVRVVGTAGQALAESYAADRSQRAEVGLGGLLAGLGDRKVRRTLGFLLEAARRFGDLLDRDTRQD
jgi:hypothetical protein